MDAKGLIVEDGYVIVGRAGQRVPLRPAGTGNGPAVPRIDTVVATRLERGTESGAPLADGLVRLAGVPCVSRGQLSSVGLSGSGATRTTN